ncbi:hypothetical protein LTS14_007014 [Recurvomyces mirabilis]|uniref:uncharacterized protein n=1 Tax=Recurvomyces mirabilis TaxID=574656 RepID=UPI002DDE7D2F|nr:hypothetical protein LTS14_007014 [Recurvomyces mirabilis]
MHFLTLVIGLTLGCAIAGPVRPAGVILPIETPAPPFPTIAPSVATKAPYLLPRSAFSTTFPVETITKVSGEIGATVTGCTVTTISAHVATLTFNSTSTTTDSDPGRFQCICPSIDPSVIVDVFTQWDHVGNPGEPTAPYASPSAEPSSAVNGAQSQWANVSCSEGGAFASITNDPLWQWNVAGTEAAWNELVADYVSNATNELAFSDFLADRFHAPRNPTCDKVGDEFCSSTIGCGSWLFHNADVNSPAGYILYNSMVYLHRTISVFSNSIIQAQINVNGFAGNIAGTFSGVEAEIAEEQQQKLNYDIIQLVLGISLSLPSTPFFKGGDDAEGAALRGSDLGTVPSGIQNAVDPVVSVVTSNKLDPGVGQDWTTAAVSISFPTTSEQSDQCDLIYRYSVHSPTSKTRLPIQHNLTTYITYLANVVQNATQLYAEGLFNDPGNLYTVIQQGHVFGSPIREEPVTIAAELTQTLLANTLPFGNKLFNQATCISR